MNGIYGFVTRLPAFLKGKLSGLLLSGPLLPGPLLVAASMVVLCEPVSPEPNIRELMELRADYFINALRFIRWTEPAMPDEPIHVVLIGNGTVCTLLSKRLPGMAIRGRPLDVYQVDDAGSNSDVLSSVVEQADTIYFGDSSSALLKAVIPNLPHRILTVSSILGFVRYGGMIEIAQQTDRQVAFQINSAMLKSPALSLDSQMLKLSTIVNVQKQDSSGK